MNTVIRRRAMNVLSNCLCCLVAAGQAAPARTAQINNTRIAAHIRRWNMWPDEVRITIGRPQPSKIRGFLVVPYHADAGHDITLDASVLLSSDRRWLFRDDGAQVEQDTFSRNLDFLSLGHLAGYGSTNSKVIVTVFGDFQCPSCREESLTMRKRLPALYGQNVRVVFADFPLKGLHDWSEEAALAGRCVYNQARSGFWAYHDWVYRSQGDLTASNFRNKADQFISDERLDEAAFNNCIVSAKASADVDESLRAGHSLSISVLPTVFVNGRRLENPKWPELQRAIDFELKQPGASPCACSIDP